LTIHNDLDEDLTFDYYSIDSPGGALDPRIWNSLADQGIGAGGGSEYDFNGDGVVNGNDLTDAADGWEARFGDDLNGNDFLGWQQDFGVEGGDPAPGGSWEEAGGIGSALLSELFLSGATTLGPGEELSLGAGFDPSIFGLGNAGDLVFGFGAQGQNILGPGTVEYVSGGAGAVVPEPGSICFAGLALATACCLHRRCARRRN
jgi:hypothetical protein